MKHPALARVLSVALVILGVLLLRGGVKGIGKSAQEQENRLAYAQKLDGRIDNYITLHEELMNSADYDETMAALKTFVEQHEKAASKHRMDTATYTATKGGLKMGDTLISSAQQEIEELRNMLKNATDRKIFLEGLLTELIASNKSKMPWLDALANQAAGYAVESYEESVKVLLVTSQLRALMEAEPSPTDYMAQVYTPPEPPAPFWAGLPDLGGIAYDSMQAAYDAAASQFMSAAADYQQAGELYAQQMQDYYDEMAQQEWDRLNGMQDQFMGAVSEAAYSAEYILAHKLWEEECREVKMSFYSEVLSPNIQRLCSALISTAGQLRQLPASWQFAYSGFTDGLDGLASLGDSLAGRLSAYGPTDYAKLSNEAFLLFADELEDFFDMLTDAFICVASHLNNPAGLIAELLEKLHLAEVLADLADGLFKNAESRMQSQLELMWYKLGDLDKDQLRLEAEKLGLDKEAALLSKRTLDADSLKELRNRHATARQLLVNIPEVRSAMGPDDEPVESARAYLEVYRRETRKLSVGRLLINVFSVLGGLSAALSIPASFEFLKSRFSLLAPPVCCLLCAAAVDGTSLFLYQKQHLVALFTAIFALLHFLIVLPQKKRPSYRPKHIA